MSSRTHTKKEKTIKQKKCNRVKRKIKTTLLKKKKAYRNRNKIKSGSTFKINKQQKHTKPMTQQKKNNLFTYRMEISAPDRGGKRGGRGPSLPGEKSQSRHGHRC